MSSWMFLYSFPPIGEVASGVFLHHQSWKVTVYLSSVGVTFNNPHKKAIIICEISDNIFYHEPVPAHDVVKVSASADMGLSLVEDTCLSHFYSMPNKVFEYLFAGLPVVVSNMAETALLVQKYDVGEVLADPTPQTLRASLLAVDAARNYNHRMKSLIRGMCWQRQEEKMLSVYENLFQDSNI